MIYGGAERLARSIGIFWSRLHLARKAELLSVRSSVIDDRLFESPDAVHDFMIFPWQSEEASLVYEDLDGWLRDLLAGDVEPTSEEIASPDWKDIMFKQRATKQTLKAQKSPRMGPTHDSLGVLTMIGDMSDEGLRSVFVISMYE